MQENVALIPLIIRTKPYNLASIQKQMQDVPLIIRTEPYNLASIQKQMQDVPLIIRTEPYNLASIQKQMQHDFALIDKAVLFERLIYRGVSSQIGYETVLYIILCST